MSADLSPKLGILGGMGPLATVDFLAKLVAATPARRDEDHIPVVVWSVPQVPPRVPAIEGDGESPLPSMLAGLRGLRGCGVTLAAIACNTAHHWHEALARESGIELLHIAEAAGEVLASRLGAQARVSLLATRGTHRAGFYGPHLARRHLQALPFDPQLQHDCVDPAIDAVKAGELDRARSLARAALDRERARGAQAVLLGCTELPLAFTDAPAHGLAIVDATEALAQACVRRWFHARGSATGATRTPRPGG